MMNCRGALANDEPRAFDITLPMEEAVLRLNNQHATELSFLDPGRLRTLLQQAFFARAIGHVDAFLIALPPGASYDSPNYSWFQARYDRFVYVDRVAVALKARGRGFAKCLYRDLIARAMLNGQSLVTCEINSDPPNPASGAFHTALGFSQVGTATIHAGLKTVRYFALDLLAPTTKQNRLAG